MIYTAVHKRSFGTSVKKRMKETMSVYRENASEDNLVSEVWDVTQMGLECCGVDGPRDWRRRMGRSNVPDSCCVKERKIVFKN